MAARPGPPRGQLALWGHFLMPQVTEAERGGEVSQGGALVLADGGGLYKKLFFSLSSEAHLCFLNPIIN